MKNSEQLREDVNRFHLEQELKNKPATETKVSDFQEKGRPLTFGEKAVGINFNVSGDDLVDRAKRIMADAIDLMNDFRSRTDITAGAIRHASVSITDLETAQMRMVKAITWKD